jgi:hypothetical protein
MDDPYFKLKPFPPTPEDELCRCASIKEINLAYKLGNNPLNCLKCNGEIPPERIALNPDVA